MKFGLKCLYDKGGMLTLPELALSPTYFGVLVFEPSRRDNDNCRTARFMDSEKTQASDIVSPLVHATIGPPYNESLTVRGFEIRGGVRVRQCWLLRPVGEKVVNQSQ